MQLQCNLTVLCQGVWRQYFGNNYYYLKASNNDIKNNYYRCKSYRQLTINCKDISSGKCVIATLPKQHSCKVNWYQERKQKNIPRKRNICYFCFADCCVHITHQTGGLQLKPMQQTDHYHIGAITCLISGNIQGASSLHARMLCSNYLSNQHKMPSSVTFFNFVILPSSHIIQ